MRRGLRAMVLAAGLGMRMRPLTLLRAKPALPVLNRPLLRWTLELLARHGVTDVVINLHHLAETIVSAVGDGGAFGLRVAYSRERTILGTAGGPRRVRDFFGEGLALIVNGDVAFDFDLTRLVARHRASGARATLALKPNPDPRWYSPIVTAEGGRIRSIAGVPPRAAGTVSLFTGVQVLDPAILDRLPQGPSETVRDLYAPLLARGERLLGLRVPGPWYDLGSPAAYIASQLSMLRSGFRGLGRRRGLVDPSARVADGARVFRSIVGAGAVVESGASVVGSVVWDGVVVGRGAVVDGSILAGGVRIGAGESVRRVVAIPRRRTRLA